MQAYDKRLEKVEALANFLDKKYHIPGTSIPVGMDGIIGLIPVVGDTATSLLSAWIIYQAHQCEASTWLKLRMGLNVFVDWLIGLIPFFGDIFDIAWQANTKNSRLLAKHLKV